MSERAVISSDLERARERARRLAGNAASPSSTTPPPSGLPSFSMSAVSGVKPASLAPMASAPPPPAPAAPAPPPAFKAPPLPAADAAWATVLDWVVGTCRVDVAALTDLRGLMVASSGGAGAGYLEEVAARLVIALEQAEHMTPVPDAHLAVTVELPSRMVTGVRVGVEDVQLVLVLVSRQPVPLDVRAAGLAAVVRRIEKQLADAAVNVSLPPA